MTRSQAIQNFLTNLESSSHQAYRASNRAHRQTDALNRNVNLRHYHNNQAYPGHDYLLVGNSFNTEKSCATGKKRSRRANAINRLLQAEAGYLISVQEALSNKYFTDILSRFEFDWLSKEAASTLLGPAFDRNGNIISDSFAVWREESTLKARPTREKVLTH